MPCFCESTEHNGSAKTTNYATTSQSTQSISLAQQPSESPTQYGQRIHSLMSQRERQELAQGTLWQSRDWEVMTNSHGNPILERSAGGDKRIDAAYVNHTSRHVLVLDYFTGKGQEPTAHAKKGWSYSKEPDIQSLIDEGYTFQYSVLRTRETH